MDDQGGYESERLADTDAPTCRLVSYNVLYEGVAPDGHSWADRSEAVIAELERLAPDIIVFQEAWRNQYEQLQSALSSFSWVTAAESPAHTPIAYRTDRFNIGDSGVFWLSPPEAEPATPGWDGAYQRLATHATLRDRDTGRSLTVLNVHLDHEGEQARLKGVELARDRLANIAAGSEIVLAGDFNCRPGDPAHRRATADRDGWRSLVDAASVATETAGPSESYTGFPEQAYEPQNIDHVLVSDGITVDRVETCVPPGESEFRPSDHRPELAEFTY